jgi:hypothetical protein
MTMFSWQIDDNTTFLLQALVTEQYSDCTVSTSSTYDFTLFSLSSVSSDRELDPISRNEMVTLQVDGQGLASDLSSQVEANIFYESNQSYGNRCVSILVIQVYILLSLISDSRRDVVIFSIHHM